MDFVEFVAYRRQRWDRINTLLDKIDVSGPAALSASEADELFSLYRLASGDLNLVQTRGGNPAILEYLERSVGRAYAVLTVDRRASIVGQWWRIMRHEFPARIRSQAPLVFMSAITMIAGSLLGYVSTLIDSRSAELFVPAEHLVESPAQRVARLEAREREGANIITSSSGIYSAFSTFLLTHNIRVSMLCIALGFTCGIGTVALLFFNGAMVGSLAAMYQMDSVMVFFVAWVGPHGAIELPCVVFAGTAGLIIARAQLRRDRGTLRDQLRAARPTLIHLLVGLATLLILAGFIEGGFSQMNEPTISYGFKIMVAVVLFSALVSYLTVLPVRTAEDRDAPHVELTSIGAS